MEPRLVDLGEIHLVGLPYYGDPSGGTFGQAWERFMQSQPEVTARVNPTVAYGVEVYGPEFMQEHKWTYFPSVEVSSLADLPVPSGLFAKTLPAAKYAVFHVKGGLAKIGEVFRYAYDEWLPASQYEAAYPYDFESYGEDFKGDVDESEMDVYIPVKPKAG